jgi:hypothetical protein
MGQHFQKNLLLFSCSRNVITFMEAEGSLLCPQEPAICSHPKLLESEFYYYRPLFISKHNALIVDQISFIEIGKFGRILSVYFSLFKSFI